MRKDAIAGFVLLALVLGGCSESDPAKPVEASSVKFAVRLNMATVDAGEPLWASVVFEKATDEAFVFRFPINACRVGFEIYSGQDLVVKFPATCEGEPGTWDISSAGVHMLHVLVPTGEFHPAQDVPNKVWLHDDRRLSPGRYRLHIGMIGYEDTFPWLDTFFEVE